MRKWRILTKDFTLPFTLPELKTKANFSDHFLSVSYCCVDKIIQIMIPGGKGGAIMGYQVLNRENEKILKMFSRRILPTT